MVMNEFVSNHWSYEIAHRIIVLRKTKINFDNMNKEWKIIDGYKKKKKV